MKLIALVVLAVVLLAAIVARVVRRTREVRRRRLPELAGPPGGELDLVRLRQASPAARERPELVDFIADLRNTSLALVEFIESRPPELRERAWRIMAATSKRPELAERDPAAHAAYVIASAALEAVGDRARAALRLVEED